MHYLIVAVRMKLDSYNSLKVEEHFRWREHQVFVLCLRITATISSFLTPLLIFLSLIFHSLLDNCQSAVLKFKIFAFIFNNLVCSVCVCCYLLLFLCNVLMHMWDAHHQTEVILFWCLIFYFLRKACFYINSCACLSPTALFCIPNSFHTLSLNLHSLLHAAYFVLMLDRASKTLFC